MIPRCALLLFFALFVSCSERSVPARAENQKLKILVSTLPIYSFAASVAGSAADVENLLPGKVDPHEYQFSPGDLRKLRAADVVLLNGLGLEAALMKAIEANQKRGKPQVFEVTSGMVERLIPTGHDHHGHSHSSEPDGRSAPAEYDPHVWLDPQLAQLCVSNILVSLSSADPANAPFYRTNAALYLQKLETLDQELEGVLQTAKDSPFVTQHNAFPYFVRRYGLKLACVIEEDPEVSPGSRHLAELHRTVREQRARAVFIEPSSPSRLARQIASDLNLKVAELDPLETGESTPAAYEEGMRRNARVLAETLR